MSTRPPRNGPPASQASARKRSRGFTLVELLVVIGIIALLISLLLPALNKAQAASRQIQCASNLRTLGQAAFIYASEYHGNYPPIFEGDTSLIPGFDGVHWPRPALYGLLVSYGVTTNENAVRTCPTIMANLINPGGNTFSYIYNDAIGGDLTLTANNIQGPQFVTANGNTYRIDRPMKVGDTAGPNVSNTGLFADCYQYGVWEGSGSGTEVPGIPSYAWTYQTTTTGFAPNKITKVTILTDSWGGQHQSLNNFVAVHNITYLANGQIRGQNNVCYCDGSVRASTIQYRPGQPGGAIWSDTGLIPSVAP
jgi:prepilin-type N-terminal cleavage/methylation domain-containing protein/prepilin-type processing-associated H-X9-DG protein